ncbi:MAG: fumarate hydratase [bacterium JZ-2024 1]
MREISAEEIKKSVVDLIQQANFFLPETVIRALQDAREKEESPIGKQTLDILIENAKIARDERMPLCQDTGTAIFFVEIGQDVHITGGYLNDILQEAVREGYQKFYLRKSLVSDPLFDRKNTKDNTPAMIHTQLVPGDRLKILFAPKGGGCENMSGLWMLTPAQGVEDIKKKVLEFVEWAGPNPCPPVVVGIGIGGSFDQCALLAKKACLRPIGSRNPDPRYAQLELELLSAINSLGIGPMGYGGTTTALDVHIEYLPTHITQLPLAINLQCHSARYAEVIL